ncbi:hypothetical protein HYPSUDRAFT_210121 [Hypholoma sublateritium FD-334 SS-4]|uniref:Uncharacterized protein n=1 Tax=Hypholoma sublateritium (strain FD-334 SS-4) TaxID=945553 RepID=A0A0D2KE42_HYPSF|nr:hypothetical protein HYPSUDRAFT_210121 [Hypholoma sublateritium FD-334 SS-4]
MLPPPGSAHAPLTYSPRPLSRRPTLKVPRCVSSPRRAGNVSRSAETRRAYVQRRRAVRPHHAVVWRCAAGAEILWRAAPADPPPRRLDRRFSDPRRLPSIVTSNVRRDPRAPASPSCAVPLAGTCSVTASPLTAPTHMMSTQPSPPPPGADTSHTDSLMPRVSKHVAHIPRHRIVRHAPSMAEDAPVRRWGTGGTAATTRGPRNQQRTGAYRASSCVDAVQTLPRKRRRLKLERDVPRVISAALAGAYRASPNPAISRLRPHRHVTRSVHGVRQRRGRPHSPADSTRQRANVHFDRSQRCLPPSIHA